MKFVYSLVLIFCLLTSPVMSQIPNFSFENWTTMGNYEVPDQWGCLNNTTDSSGSYTVTKGTPGNPGNSYLKVTSRTIGSAIVPGIAVSGVLDSITMQAKTGFACSQRPQSITGNWQYMSFSGSPGSISITLTRWDSLSGTRETVASAIQTLPGMVMSWSFFSINLNYLTGNIPDTCIIVLEASGPNPDDNDYVWVDNLGFSGTVIGVADQAVGLNSITLLPNPANEVTIISLNSTGSSTTSVELLDPLGQKVMDVFTGSLFEGENRFEINTSGLASGVYFIRSNDESGVRTSKLTISH